MTRLIKFVTCLSMLAFLLASCKKERHTSTGNKPPVADAGIDVFVSILSCNTNTAFAELDGSSSSDPDSNIIRYKWVALYGPAGYIIANSTSVKTRIDRLSPGQYAFQLSVTDEGGLSSKDTVLISVQGHFGVPKEYDLDISLSTQYNFLQNYFNPWEGDTYHYDETYMKGIAVSQPLGGLTVDIFEFADADPLSDKLFDSFMQIAKISDNSTFTMYVKGDLSGINFKKLIRQGGGLFNGICTVTDGSAKYCDPNVFTNLPPLIVTGSLDVGTTTVSLNVKGKVYF